MVAMLCVVMSTVGTRVVAEDETAGSVRITIIYDNTVYRGGVRADWGFAAVIERGGEMILFDTGASGRILFGNMEALGFDPSDVDAVILSHAHADHTGGLAGLLSTRVHPTVYLPAAFPERFKNDVRALTTVVETHTGDTVVAGLRSVTLSAGTTTGGRALVEQAVAVETPEGLVLVTGCAHPGIVPLAEEAIRIGGAGTQIALAMGGFHLMNLDGRSVERVMTQLRELGVERVMPAHCTGPAAIEQFASFFGPACLDGGAGRSVSFSPRGR